MNAVDFIQHEGFVMHFWGHPNRYLYLDGHFYWVMRDSEEDKTTIINRCNADEYYVSTKWKGTNKQEATIV